MTSTAGWRRPGASFDTFRTDERAVGRRALASCLECRSSPGEDDGRRVMSMTRVGAVERKASGVAVPRLVRSGAVPRRAVAVPGNANWCGRGSSGHRVTGDDRRPVAVCEGAASACIDRGTDEDAAVHETDTEVALRDHRPRAPGIVPEMAADTDLEHWTIIEAKRAPAHVARRMSPRNPRRRPRAPGDPVPRASGRDAPPSVVVRRPAPRVRANPCPAVRAKRRPAAVVIGAPAVINAWVPHVPIRRLGTPTNRNDPASRHTAALRPGGTE